MLMQLMCFGQSEVSGIISFNANVSRFNANVSRHPIKRATQQLAKNSTHSICEKV